MYICKYSTLPSESVDVEIKNLSLERYGLVFDDCAICKVLEETSLDFSKNRFKYFKCRMFDGLMPLL